MNKIIAFLCLFSVYTFSQDDYDDNDSRQESDDNDRKSERPRDVDSPRDIKEAREDAAESSDLVVGVAYRRYASDDVTNVDIDNPEGVAVQVGFQYPLTVANGLMGRTSLQLEAVKADRNLPAGKADSNMQSLGIQQVIGINIALPDNSPVIRPIIAIGIGLFQYEADIPSAGAQAEADDFYYEGSAGVELEFGKFFTPYAIFGLRKANADLEGFAATPGLVSEADFDSTFLQVGMNLRF